ncbi:hypothetical protein E2C06_06880 [Dankookia rubra]|uniref:Uncharacterized protein n=1 Tax=Dankookia rubra TaxID=1442381 RepID=A0A4R5QK33_9PROT|nr:hypothetical protein [Dankookia rubra]TDH63546.1 hypothetical protein E2C06_06880 [Dankookia rubra]
MHVVRLDLAEARLRQAERPAERLAGRRRGLPRRARRAQPLLEAQQHGVAPGPLALRRLRQPRMPAAAPPGRGGSARAVARAAASRSGGRATPSTCATGRSAPGPGARIGTATPVARPPAPGLTWRLQAAGRPSARASCAGPTARLSGRSPGAQLVVSRIRLAGSTRVMARASKAAAAARISSRKAARSSRASAGEAAQRPFGFGEFPVQQQRHRLRPADQGFLCLQALGALLPPGRAAGEEQERQRHGKREQRRQPAAPRGRAAPRRHRGIQAVRRSLRPASSPGTAFRSVQGRGLPLTGRTSAAGVTTQQAAPYSRKREVSGIARYMTET